MVRRLALGSLLLAPGALASNARVWSTPQGDNQGVLRSNDVKGLCDPDVKSQSGYFAVNGTKNLNYFYWFFESRSDPDNDPVVMWLTGGPGCSSILALFAENGPCSVNEDGSDTKLNPFSWNSNANIFWIDQPAGVGFSYGDESDYASNEDDVSEDLYQFLQAFLTANSHLQKNPFYIFGESYGGHYAPATSFRVFQGNQRGEGLPINLKGVGVGNGLTDPEIQYQYYPTMAFNNSYGIKAVDEETYQGMVEALPKCISLIHDCQEVDVACGYALGFCNEALAGPYAASGLNTYDVRIPCAKPPLCYDFSNVDTFLSNPRVLRALNVADEAGAWQECNMDVNSAFRRDFLKNYHLTLPPMLEAGIRVLIYAGDSDYICNWYGNKAWTMTLPWAMQTSFAKAADQPWAVDGQAAGEVRTVGGFTFLRVFGAGHMVPMDQPEVALEMFNGFVHGSDF